MKTVSDQDIKFLLKSPRSDRPTLISLFYRYANQRLVYSTGLTIEPFQWDTEHQRAYTNQKNRVACEPFEMINAHLDRYRSIFKTALTRLQLANIPFTNESIKQQLDAETGRVKKDTLLRSSRKAYHSKIEDRTFLRSSQLLDHSKMEDRTFIYSSFDAHSGLI